MAVVYVGAVVSAGLAYAADLRDDPACMIDQSSSLQRLIDNSAGGRVSLPRGTFGVARGPLLVKAKHTHIVGAGVDSTNLCNAATPGSSVLPIIDVLPTAEASDLSNLTVDQRADVLALAPPQRYGASILAASAVLLQADHSGYDTLKVLNGWDNCVAIGAMKGDGTMIAGSPHFFRGDHLTTSGCGVGIHPAVPKLQPLPGRIGAGLDIASGSEGYISNSIDVGSYNGFIMDLGAGASGSFNQILVYDTKKDPRISGSGIGFYIGGSNSVFSNLVSIGAKGVGFLYDGTANNDQFQNVLVRQSENEAFHIRGSGMLCVSCRAEVLRSMSSAFKIQRDGGMALNDTLIAPSVVTLGEVTVNFAFEFDGKDPTSGNIVGASVNKANHIANKIPSGWVIRE